MYIEDVAAKLLASRALTLCMTRDMLCQVVI